MVELTWVNHIHLNHCAGDKRDGHNIDSFRDLSSTHFNGHVIENASLTSRRISDRKLTEKRDS